MMDGSDVPGTFEASGNHFSRAFPGCKHDSESTVSSLFTIMSSVMLTAHLIFIITNANNESNIFPSHPLSILFSVFAQNMSEVKVNWKITISYREGKHMSDGKVY